MVKSHIKLYKGKDTRNMHIAPASNTDDNNHEPVNNERDIIIVEEHSNETFDISTVDPNNMSPQEMEDFEKYLIDSAAEWDRIAKSEAFDKINRKLSRNTKSAYAADLQRFAEFAWPFVTDDAGVRLQQGVPMWRYVTHGQVEGLVTYMLRDGYSLSTIDRAIASVKTYARAAFQAGHMNTEQERRIANIEFMGTKAKTRKNIDESRGLGNTHKKRSKGRWKKAKPTKLTNDQVRMMLNNHDFDTLRGLRDAVMIGLLTEFAMRSEEASILKWESIDEDRRSIRIERPKVANEDGFAISPTLFSRLMRLKKMHDSEYVLVGVTRGDEVGVPQMSRSLVSKMVNKVAAKCGIEKIHAHDLRAWRSTDLHRRGVDRLDIQRYGGWSDMRMVDHYIAESNFSEEDYTEDMY